VTSILAELCSKTLDFGESMNILTIRAIDNNRNTLRILQKPTPFGDSSLKPVNYLLLRARTFEKTFSLVQ
jgi:hypothetical protein